MYITPIDKDLDAELNDSSTDDKNEEDLQDYDSPTEDNPPSEDDEGPKSIHYKPDRETFGDPFDEDFDTWIINTNSNSDIESDPERDTQFFLTACDMKIITNETSDEETQQDF